MAIRYSDPGIIDEKVVALQRVCAINQTANNRVLSGFTLLSESSVKSLPTDTIHGIDCDEVYPNVFIGDE